MRERLTDQRIAAGLTAVVAALSGEGAGGEIDRWSAEKAVGTVVCGDERSDFVLQPLVAATRVAKIGVALDRGHVERGLQQLVDVMPAVIVHWRSGRRALDTTRRSRFSTRASRWPCAASSSTTRGGAMRSGAQTVASSYVTFAVSSTDRSVPASAPISVERATGPTAANQRRTGRRTSSEHRCGSTILRMLPTSHEPTSGRCLRTVPGAPRFRSPPASRPLVATVPTRLAPTIRPRPAGARCSRSTANSFRSRISTSSTRGCSDATTAEAGCPVGVPDCRTGGRADLQRRHGAGCGPRRREAEYCQGSPSPR